MLSREGDCFLWGSGIGRAVLLGFLILIAEACIACLVLLYVAKRAAVAIVGTAILAPVLWHISGYLYEGEAVLTFLPISLVISAFISAIVAVITYYLTQLACR